MPIKGLTDRGLAFPEIGQIRKGAKKEEYKPGRDLTYFRVEFDAREEEAARIFEAKYGKQPQQIVIMLPFDNIDDVWSAWYEAYTASRLVARSDGEYFVYRINTETGEVMVKDGNPKMPHQDIVGSYMTSKGKKEQIKMKPVGRLRVVVPELARLAYLTLMTTSLHDVANITSQLEAIKRINGSIAGVPLVLRRRPKMISVPKPDGSRARMEKWMVSIEADPEWVKAKLMDMKHAALPGNGLSLLPESSESEIQPAYRLIESDIIPDDEMEDADEIPTSAPEIIPPKQELTRPYSPETLRVGIEKQAKMLGGKTVTKAQEESVVGSLQEIYQDNATFSYALKFLTGFPTIKEVPNQYLLALIDWLKPEKDSGGAYHASAMAAREAALIPSAAAAMPADAEQGQQPLPLD